MNPLSNTKTTAPQLQNAAAVEEQLQRIFAHGEFARADLVKKLLRYMVEKALARASTELSERSIAQSVFNRGNDWDSKLDPVVRITVMRLRKKLDAYYLVVGKDDPVLIHVPKGQYTPVIEPRPGSQTGLVSGSLPKRPALGHKLILTLSACSLIIVVTLMILVQQHEVKAAILPVSPLSTEIGTQFAPAISPDGNAVAYVWDGNGGNLDIYIKDIPSGIVKRFTNRPEPELNPAWSPDGRSLAFLRVKADTVTVVVNPVSGEGQERVVATFPAEFGTWVGDESPLLGNIGPEWSTDGTSLLVSEPVLGGTQHAMVGINLNTMQQKQITITDKGIRDYYPRLSPDGRYLAFVRYATHGIGEVYVANRDGSNPHVLTNDRRTVQGIAWTADSRSIVLSSNRTGSFQLWIEGIDGDTPRQLALNSSSAEQPSIRGDSLVFVETEENWNIWKTEVATGVAKEPVRIISSSGRNYDPRISPDGTTIAFVSDRSGSWQLWLCGPNGDNLRQLTHFGTAWLGSPGWSGDGRQIVFDARPDGHSGIFSADVATGNVAVLQKSGAEERSPSWSRDGRSLYFNSNRDGVVAIYKKELQTGQIRQITGRDGFAAAESLDGKSLYFSTTFPGELWRSQPDGSHPVLLSQAVQLVPAMAWTPFDRGVYFSSADNHAHRSALYSVIDDKTERIGATKMPIVAHTPSLGASSDGHILLYAEQDQIRSNLKMSHLKGN
jgi:Tol biopolymer transport system component